MAANTTMTIADLAHRFVKYFNDKNGEGIGTLLAEDFALFDPALKWLHGKKCVIDTFKKQFHETQFVEYKIIRFFEDGDTGILEFQITMDTLILYGVDFIQAFNGQMKELRCYYNPPNAPEKGTLQPLSFEAQSLITGSLYEHYKGKQYKLLSVARHSETLEELVVYQALYGEKGIWVRPLKMFLESIELNGEKIPRFKRLSGGSN